MTTELERERSFALKLVRLFEIGWEIGETSGRYRPMSEKELRQTRSAEYAEKDALVCELVKMFVDRKPVIDEQLLADIKKMLQDAFPSATERDLLKYSVDVYINLRRENASPS